MPLITLEKVGPDIRLGLWAIESSIAELLAQEAALLPIFNGMQNIHSSSRKLEKLAVYALLFSMVDDKSLRILHDTSSRPALKGYNISISHTRGYVALMLSESHRVGVDIEYISDRVARVSSRFMRTDEQGDTIASKLINWCAKEAIYKLFSEEHLQYFDMRLHPFEEAASGLVTVEDLKCCKTQTVHYRVTNQYVLTYAYR